MPIYEYICNSCGYEFEEVQKFSDPSFDKCPSCGRITAKRKVSISSFHLKGGGWYKDGYSNKESKGDKPASSEKEKESSKNLGESKSDTTSGNPANTEKKESVPSKKSSTSKKEKAA